MAAHRSSIALLLLLVVSLLLAVPWSTAASPAAPAADVVAFVGNHVVDLAWDQVQAEWYEVTRNGVPAGCNPAADPNSGKIFCRDGNLASSETYTYLVEAINGDERTTIGQQSATTGFVRGTLYHNLAWNTPGETYALDGAVLVTNGAVLTIGSNVSVEKWSSPSEAAGIQTEGSGGLQVTSASPATTFDDIYLRLGADADFITGQEDAPVPLRGISMRLTNAALINHCAFSRSAIEITEEGGVPSLSNSHFVNIPIWISATSSPVVFDHDRFGDPVLGDFWLDEGGQVAISNSLFAASWGIGVEVGTNSVATLTNNTFNIADTGVLVWPGVGAEVTVTDNIFHNIAPDVGWSSSVFGWDGSRHPHSATGQNSTILVADNTFAGEGVRGISLTGGVDLEAHDNSFVQGSTAFQISSTPRPDLELGSVRINNNCIASRDGGSIATTSALNVDASGNWWGSPSGPTVEGNPDGDGATITISSGNLTYDGWLRSENCDLPWRNLAPRDMEAVQVVQTWDNQVPLVAGRPTVVRVYPGAYPGRTADVSGELAVIRDGAQMGTVRPAAPRTVDYFLGLDAGTQLAYRSVPDNGLFFKVPGAWVGGVMTFTVEINADRAYEEYDYTDNFLSESYTTVARPPANVGIVPTNYDPDETRTLLVAPSLADTLQLADLFSRIYPGDEVNLTLFPTLHWPHRLDGHGLYPKYRSVGGAFMNTLGLSQMRLAATGEIVAPPPDLVYGAIDPAAWDFSTIFDSFYEPLWTSRATVSYGKNYGHLFALRQLGYLGLWGVPARRTAEDGECYFYDVGYDVAGDRVVGYGHDTCRLTSSYPDITDPGRYWLDVEQYQNLLAYVSPAAPAAPAVEQAYVAVLVNISGKDEVELLPAWQFATATPPHNPPTGDGTYCVELRDTGDATLSSHCFDLKIAVGSLAWDHVLVALPLSGEPARVAIRRGATEIGEIAVSDHAPVVTIARGPQAPPAALAADGTLSLSWTASDDDGGDLEYSILVSSDDGTTWLPVSANFEATTFDLDLSEIPAGTQLWVRVEASDGFNVGSADYGPFSLANHAPEVVIHAPANGAAIEPTTSLSGFAYDREEGLLKDASLLWTSSLDGELGAGPLAFTAALSEGRHTVTLTATDGAGASGSATVVVTVGDAPAVDNALYLPLLIGR